MRLLHFHPPPYLCRDLCLQAPHETLHKSNRLEGRFSAPPGVGPAKCTFTQSFFFFEVQTSI